MPPKTKFEDLPLELGKSLRETDLIVRSYLAGVSFIVKDTARDPAYADNHLLYYLAHDLLQSAISIVTLAMEGLQNVAKRELRFLLEASIKLCFVQEKNYNSSVTEKLEQFQKELMSQRISINQNLNLKMLPNNLRQAFSDEAGRVYGLTSNYVHLTPLQIKERIAAIEAGKTAEKETAADIEALNILVSRGLAISLVLLFHSVPEYVAGDWLVEHDGKTADWYFTGSVFIAGIDSHFDYKRERQAELGEIIATRQAKILF